MQNKSSILRHLCMATACAFWGVMAPLAKDAMGNGFPGFTMVTFRVAGAALLFWLTDTILRLKKSPLHEKVAGRDVFRFFLASFIGVTFNQSAFTIGVSLTSPIHATLMTTTLPIISLLIAVVFFHEKLTWKKVLGITCGLGGALTLILSSGGGLGGGNIWGDLLCVFAQCSFASYLVVFKDFIRKFSVITCMKWMMLFATLTLLPFTICPITQLEWSTIPLKSYTEAGYVVVVGTYICYVLMTYAQKQLKPTVVAMYNYVQPIVATIVTLLLGLAIFGIHQGIAVVFIFFGVYMVTKEK